MTRIRPLFEVYEENILNYAIASNICFVAGECPLKHLGAVEVESREYIEKLERRTPGSRLTAIRNILRMLRKEGRGWTQHHPNASYAGCLRGRTYAPSAS